MQERVLELMLGLHSLPRQGFKMVVVTGIVFSGYAGAGGAAGEGGGGL